MNHRKFLDNAHKWRMDTKRFDGTIEKGHTPPILTGTDIEELLSGYVNQFGLKKKKGNSQKGCPFKKSQSSSICPIGSIIHFDITLTPCT